MRALPAVGAEGGGEGTAEHGRHRTGQLELESGPPVRLGTLRRQPAPPGVCLQASPKRLLKANEAKREAFAAEYAALWEEAGRTGGKIFFADEAHFRADAELRGKWVLKGEPAPVKTGAGSGGLQQSEVRREGQLLLSSVPGDRRGGVDGTGGEQQRPNIGDLPEATEGEASWAIERHLGQRADAPSASSGVARR